MSSRARRECRRCGRVPPRGGAAWPEGLCAVCLAIEQAEEHERRRLAGIREHRASAAAGLRQARDDGRILVPLGNYTFEMLLRYLDEHGGIDAQTFAAAAIREKLAREIAIMEEQGTWPRS